MSDNERLRELGKQLPWDRPDATRRDAARSSLLAAANQSISAVPGMTTSPRRRYLALGSAFAAGALAAAAIAILILRPQPRPSNTVTADPSARMERTIVTTPTGVDETVRIHDGTIHLATTTLRPGDHVRIRTRDAAVEGAGDYDVIVTADALTAVTVRRGTTKVQVNGQHAVFLAAGQTWRASIITADLSPSEAVSDKQVPDKQVADKQVVVDGPGVGSGSGPGPGSGSGSGGGRARRATTPTEVHFRAGWALLRDGKAKEAAVELGAAADANPDDPLAADARYFQAVALERAGDRGQAERVLVAFLDHAPRSLRRGRAAVLLGRLLALRGDVDSARAWYKAAVDDPDPAIAGAARAGLDSLPPKR